MSAKKMITVSPKESASRRIVALDLLRGYFLFDMVLNHLNYWPNLLDWTNGRGQLFASGAEGFFLISGIVLGIVRGQKLLDKPMRIVSKLLLRRSLQLYITYIITVLFFTFIGWWLFMNNPGLKFGIALPSTPVIDVIWQTLTFQYVYGWADYLRMYTVFLVLSPLVIWLLRKGKWWIVMGVSVLVWALVPRPDWPQNIFLQPYHWQLLFFTGMTIGFHWNSLTTRWFELPARFRKIFISSLVSVTVVAVALNIFLAFGGYLGQGAYNLVAPLRDSLQRPFDKENLGIWRTIFASACFVSGFWLVNRFEVVIKKYLGWILLPFGTNSLYVYTVQAFIVFFAQLIVPGGSQNIFINAIFSFGSLGLLWLLIHYKVLFKIIPR